MWQNSFADNKQLKEYYTHSPDVLTFHASLPGYSPTPLISVPELARALHVTDVLVKDETSRFGLPAFKILGASWAVAQLLSQVLDMEQGFTFQELKNTLESARSKQQCSVSRLVAATDGNHGRAVARMAAWLGLGCNIFVPSGTSSARIEAIRNEGASAEIVPGNYDKAIATAITESESNDALLVADTSADKVTVSSRSVIQGYGTIATEIETQLAREHFLQPTVLALQAGVGAFAAGLISGLSDWKGKVITTEPLSAACIQESLRAGHPVTVPAEAPTIMAGLNCGTPSLAAWPILKYAVSDAIAVNDEYAKRAMRFFSTSGLAVGESGSGGLAGLLAYPSVLSPDDVVLLVATEGVTDPNTYRDILSQGDNSEL